MDANERAKHPVTDSIVEDVRKFKNEAVDPQDALLTSFKQGELSRRTWLDMNYGTLSLSGAECDLYKKIVERLSKFRGIGQRKDVKVIENLINPVIVAHLQDQVPTDSELRKTVDDVITQLLEETPVRTIYFPLAGLELNDVSFEMDGVTFEPLTPELISQIKSQIISIVESSPPSPYKESNLKVTLNKFDETYKNVSIGRFVIAADAEITIQAGLEEVNDKLDFLAAMLPCISGVKKRVWIEIGPPPGTDTISVFSLTSDGVHCRGFGTRPVLPFIINKARKLRMDQIGFNELIRIVSSKSKSPLENRIYRMAKWFGRGMQTVAEQEQFILTASALEACFTSGNAPITQTLAEGVAFVLGNKFEARTYFYKEVSRLYGIRSQLVHGYSLDLDSKDLKHFQGIVFDTLAMLLMNFSKFNEVGLETWVQQQKFSSSYDLIWPPKQEAI